jgi:SAM-dependent methyltransferase
LEKGEDRILEIGPSIRPLAPKRDGWRVWTIDHASREELLAKYAPHENVDTSAVEEVDFVWREGTIDDCVPVSFHGMFDACVSSHVIEHIPDFVGFFQSLEKVLTEHGTLSMAVPDKRYSFDYFRPHSTTGEVLAAHYRNASRHRMAALFDHLAYACSNKGDIAWGQSPPCELKLVHSRDGLLAFNLEQFREPPPHYVDCHGWQFTPSSFALLVFELSTLGLIDFRVRHLYAAEGFEFLAHLQKGRKVYDSMDELQQVRLDLLKAIILERGEQADLLERSLSPVAKGRRLAARMKSSAKRWFGS